MKFKIKRQSLLILGVICFVCLGSFSSWAMTPNSAREEEAKNKLEQIQQEEKDTLEELFELSANIMLIQTQIVDITEEISAIRKTSEKKEELIETETIYFEKVKMTLAKVLRSQQRSGVTSNIEVVLNAKDLKDLIWRINLLRDLSKYTSDLIEKIETSKKNLDKEQRELAEIIIKLQKEQDELKRINIEKSTAKEEMEEYLSSLEAEKAYYEDYIETVEKVWSEMKFVLTKTIKAFTEIIETGALPDDTVEVRQTLFAAKGIINEQKFNAILSTRDDLPNLIFDFHKDKVNLSFPDYEFHVEGEFILIDDQTIKYVIKKGTFYDLPLSKSAMIELFSEGDLIFSLKELIGTHRIKRIDNYEGYIELLVEGIRF